MIKKIVFTFFVMMASVANALAQLPNMSCTQSTVDLRAYELGRTAKVAIETSAQGRTPYVGIWIQRVDSLNARITYKTEHDGEPIALTVFVLVLANGSLSEDDQIYDSIVRQLERHKVAGDEPEFWALLFMLSVRDINRALAACRI